MFGFLFCLFLVADTQLYKRLCPSIGPSVGPSVGLSVGPSVGPSVMIELKSGKNERFGYFFGMLVYGVGIGVWMGV